MYFPDISKPSLLCLASAVKPEAPALAINHTKSHSDLLLDAESSVPYICLQLCSALF